MINKKCWQQYLDPASMITKLAQHLANQVVYLKGKFNEILYRQSLYKQSHQFSHQRRQNEVLESD
jgi:hypothetical protein